MVRVGWIAFRAWRNRSCSFQSPPLRREGPAGAGPSKETKQGAFLVCCTSAEYGVLHIIMLEVRKKVPFRPSSCSSSPPAVAPSSAAAAPDEKTDLGNMPITAVKSRARPTRNERILRCSVLPPLDQPLFLYCTAYGLQCTSCFVRRSARHHGDVFRRKVNNLLLLAPGGRERASP